MTETTLMVPTIHMNGTSKKALAEQNERARNALRLAIEALAAADPNGRDYDPQGPGAIAIAIGQHGDRLQGLTDVLKELHEIAEAIDAQPDGRR